MFEDKSLLVCKKLFFAGLHQLERDVFDRLRSVPEALLLRGGHRGQVPGPGEVQAHAR